MFACGFLYVRVCVYVVRGIREMQEAGNCVCVSALVCRWLNGLLNQCVKCSYQGWKLLRAPRVMVKGVFSLLAENTVTTHRHATSPHPPATFDKQKLWVGLYFTASCLTDSLLSGYDFKQASRNSQKQGTEEENAWHSWHWKNDSEKPIHVWQLWML